MRNEVIDGLVVRTWDVGECDRYLSVLTAKKGRITVLSKGSKSMRSEQRVISQMYAYSNFEIYRRGDRYILSGGSLIEPFYSLSIKMDRLNLASYFCEVAGEITDEGEDATEVLRLLLNALYATGRDLYPYEIIKGAVELRAAFLSGYAPSLNGCAVCGTPLCDPMYLDVMNGALLCPECLKKRSAGVKHTPNAYDEIREAEVLSPLPPAVLTAVRYIAAAPVERLFSFSLQDESDLHLFSKCAETYLLSHLGRGFDSLNFYHAMRQTTKGT